MTTINDEGRFSNDTKIPECDIKKENKLQWKMKFKALVIVKGFQYALKRGGNRDMCASEYTDLSSDDETKKRGKWLSDRTMWPWHI